MGEYPLVTKTASGIGSVADSISVTMAMTLIYYLLGSSIFAFVRLNHAASSQCQLSPMRNSHFFKKSNLFHIYNSWGINGL